MNSQHNIGTIPLELLRCPVCKSRLELHIDQIKCSRPDCGIDFPLVDGIPILINDKSSIFSIADIVSQHNTATHSRPTVIKRLADSILPSISTNITSAQHYEHFSQLLLQQSDTPKVLVLGGRILGQGMQALRLQSTDSLIETDITFGPRTKLICDAHDIPFADETFEGVIIQAVLNQAVNPYQCVKEIHRVLKTGGLVYAETPFMQQVLNRYDFTRFTNLGHRRLFGRFDEIDSGAACGPGMALAWAYYYFLLSFAQTTFARKLMHAIASLTSFYLKYFDYYLIQKSAAIDAASSYYFVGRKSEQVLADRDLIFLYKGCKN